MGHLSFDDGSIMIATLRLRRDTYKDQAMTGNGGLFEPGRWHLQGQLIIYGSSSFVLAALELFVNLKHKRQLARHVKSLILVPEALIVELETEHVAAFVREPEGTEIGDLITQMNRQGH